MKNGTKLLTAFAAGALAFGFSIFSQLFLMPVLAFAAVIAVEWGWYYIAPTVLGVCLGTLLFRDPGAGTYASLAMLLLVPTVLAVYGKRRFAHRYAVLILAAVVTLGTYLSMTLDSMLAGEAPYAGAVRIWEELLVVPAQEAAGSYPAYGDVAELFAELTELIPDILMPFSIAVGEFLGLFLVLFCRLFAKLLKAEPQKMAPFTEWRLPKTALWGGIILAVVIAAVYIAGFERATAIALSLGIIIVSLFSVQGLATLLFVLEAANSPKVLRVLLFVLTPLLFPYSLILLTVSGIREQITHRRRYIRQAMKEIAERLEREKDDDEMNKYGFIKKKDDKDDKEDE